MWLLLEKWLEKFVVNLFKKGYLQMMQYHTFYQCTFCPLYNLFYDFFYVVSSDETYSTYKWKNQVL